MATYTVKRDKTAPYHGGLTPAYYVFRGKTKMYGPFTNRASAQREASDLNANADPWNYYWNQLGFPKVKSNPKRKSANSSPLLPAKVRINPRTGKVQVFVSPKVAAQVKQRGNPVRGMSTTSYTVYLDKGAKVFGYKEQAKKFAQQRANETGLSVGIYQNLKGGRFGSITTVRPKR